MPNTRIWPNERRRYSLVRARKVRLLRAWPPNTWMTITPASDSARKLLMRASCTRISRNCSRAKREKMRVMTSASGTNTAITRAIRPFIIARNQKIPTSLRPSLNSETITEVNISCMFWMSLVSRVTSRPAGWPWKKARSRVRMWVNRCWRSRCITRWPIHSSSTTCRKVSTNTASTSRPYCRATSPRPATRSARPRVSAMIYWSMPICMSRGMARVATVTARERSTAAVSAPTCSEQ